MTGYYTTEYVQWLEARLDLLSNPPKSEEEPPNSPGCGPEQQLKDSISLCKELILHIEAGAPGDQLTINTINAVLAKLESI
jgi:hypothetical protein